MRIGLDRVTHKDTDNPRKKTSTPSKHANDDNNQHDNQHHNNHNNDHDNDSSPHDETPSLVIHSAVVLNAATSRPFLHGLSSPHTIAGLLFQHVPYSHVSHEQQAFLGGSPSGDQSRADG